MKDEDFKELVAFGKLYEKKTVERIPHKVCEWAEERCPFYDVILDGVKLEIKADRRMHQTGSFVIEIGAGGKPSGLTITQADFYIIWETATDTAFKVPVETLKLEIQNKNFFNAGFKKLSKICLISKDFLNNFLM